MRGEKLKNDFWCPPRIGSPRDIITQHNYHWHVATQRKQASNRGEENLMSTHIISLHISACGSIMIRRDSDVYLKIHSMCLSQSQDWMYGVTPVELGLSLSEWHNWTIIWHRGSTQMSQRMNPSKNQSTKPEKAISTERIAHLKIVT